jgi:hypothetical protein
MLKYYSSAVRGNSRRDITGSSAVLYGLTSRCREMLVIMSCKRALHCRRLFYITLYNSDKIFFSEVVMVLIS